MDKNRFEDQLSQGALQLGITLPEGLSTALHTLMEALLRWNSKVNLTAIEAPEDVLEKHFLDSLAVLPEVEEAGSLLDLGAGAGFPGIPLKLARPQFELRMVDAVGKKVAFLKAAAAQLGLKQCQAFHQRAEGHPESEGLPLAERVISRAFMDLPAWLKLGGHYVAPEGQLVAMMGRPREEVEIETLAQAEQMRLVSARVYALPFSKAERQVAVFAKQA